MEARDGVELPVYRGDLINGVAFEPAGADPDPERLLRGYERAALTLNFIRALIDGGFADLHHPEYWDLQWVHHSPLAAEYQRLAESIGDSLRFMETLSGERVGQTTRVDFFTSHEGCTCSTSRHRRGRFRSARAGTTSRPACRGSACGPSQIGGAHVEYFRGIANPIAVKVGPGTTPEGLLELAAVLDPGNEPGRLTLIHRFGARAIARGLPPLSYAVEQAGRRVLWVCDPMHGNTERTAEGFKTRAVRAHPRRARAGLRHPPARRDLPRRGPRRADRGERHRGGMGGARNLCEGDLGRAYRSFVDPRLDYEQALGLAMLIAHRMRH